MPWVTEDQLSRARDIDLLTFLKANEPGELLPPKHGIHRTVSHGSLVISDNRWYWNRGGVGGYSALDYLVKVRGMKLHEAVAVILGAPSRPLPLPDNTPNPPAPAKYKFYPPKQVRFSNRAAKSRFIKTVYDRDGIIFCHAQSVFARIYRRVSRHKQ